MSSTKIINIVFYLLLIVSAVIAGFFYLGGTIEIGGEDVPKVTETALNWTYLLFGLAIFSLIVFSIIQIIQKPKKAIKTFISIGIFLIIILIAYSSASAEILTLVGYKGEFNEPVSLKWSGTGLITMYIFLGLAILSILYTEVGKYFRR
jgi:predicted MFS family arabinose efflux permease